MLTEDYLGANRTAFHNGACFIRSLKHSDLSLSHTHTQLPPTHRGRVTSMTRQVTVNPIFELTTLCRLSALVQLFFPTQVNNKKNCYVRISTFASASPVLTLVILRVCKYKYIRKSEHKSAKLLQKHSIFFCRHNRYLWKNNGLCSISMVN